MKLLTVQNKRKEKLKQILIEKKREVLAELHKSLKEQMGEDARISFEIFQDSADKSVDDLSKHIDIKLMGNKAELLDNIEEALERLEEGSYGVCEECGENIPIERLKIVPFAVYCVNCQNKIEKLKSSGFSGEETVSIPEDADEFLTEDEL